MRMMCNPRLLFDYLRNYHRNRPQSMLDNDTSYQNILKSASYLPETNEEFYEQKSLSGLTVLMYYWRACHKHPSWLKSLIITWL